MKPIVEITEAPGAQKYVTISMIRPLLHKLLNGIFKNSEGDSRFTKIMKLMITNVLVLDPVFAERESLEDVIQPHIYIPRS